MIDKPCNMQQQRAWRERHANIRGLKRNGKIGHNVGWKEYPTLISASFIEVKSPRGYDLCRVPK